MPDLAISTGAARARLREIIREVSVEYGDFVLASGARSSVYIDLRRTTTHPEGALLAARLLLDLLADGPPVAAIGGPELAAVPVMGAVAAVSAAIDRPLPVFLVRKAPKDHGTGRQIEGHLEAGWEVAVFDDTVTGGGSLLGAVEAVEAAGARVTRVISLVDRSGGDNVLTRGGYRYESIFSLSEIVDEQSG